MHQNKPSSAQRADKIQIIRSLLFAPANRPELVLKFPRIGADCSVIDLEDGTPIAAKEDARQALPELVASVKSAGLAGLLGVRINTPDSVWFLDDIAQAVRSQVDAILVPKVQTPEDLNEVIQAIRSSGRQIAIIAGIETAAGVLEAARICRCAPELEAIFFGAEDLAGDIGAHRTRSGEEVFAARSMTLLAAKAARILAIDQAVVDIRDDQQFRRDSESGRNLGYDGKTCLTPNQVSLANALFAPTAQELAYAERLIAAYEQQDGNGRGTFDFEGKMVDTPLLKQAQRTVALAKHSTQRT